MRATNHHGRGSAKHAGREFDVTKTPHIDPARVAQNRYWTWDGGSSLEASERAYYRETFQPGLDAQNELHRQRRQHKRIRDMEQVYTSRNTQPEGSLLYIGSKRDGPIDPDVLWACAAEYRAWEQEQLGGAYVPLSMAMHVDEDGQIHVEERGVYQYRDEAGNWQIGQAAALEAAGIPLPDETQPRSRGNNRKMTWDAARREAWIDIAEAHGFVIEREPEQQRPHLGLEAWQAWQDEKAALEAQKTALEAQAAQQAIVTQQQQQTAQNQAQKAQEQAQTQASLQKWAGDLTAWRDGEQRRLGGMAAQIAADVPTSDAAVLAELDRRRGADGRTLREVIEADLTAKAEQLRAAGQTVTIKQPPQPDAVAAALAMAQQQKEREQAQRQRQQGPGFGV